MPEDVSSVADSRPTFFRRRFAPLIAAWVLALIVAGLLYWIEIIYPAFHEVLVPLYWIVGVLIVLATWRWVRTRGKGDRRGKERRHGDRRHDLASASDSSRAPDRDDIGDRSG
jgi:fatty acid desaturase